MALAEYLGLSSITADEWAALARERGAPIEMPLFRTAFVPSGGATVISEADKTTSPPIAAEPAPLAIEGLGGKFGVESVDEKLSRLMKANRDIGWKR